jgi:uncharacterized protein YlxW (UPF0749 family)
MDYKERYFDLLEKTKRLETTLNSLQSNNITKTDEVSNNESQVNVLDEILGTFPDWP